MSSSQSATCHVPSLLCSRLVLLISWLYDPFKSLLATTSSISSCTMMVDLPNILASATSLSTRRCTGGHCRQVIRMFANTRVMPNSQSRSSETWLVVKGKSSLIVCCTMLPLCMEPGSTGSSNAAASLPS